jgi:hypothetical protein
MNRLNPEAARGDEHGHARSWSLADLVPVLEALHGLRYGSVELIIQDSRLVQIDRKEKIRPFKG